jgi:hypothetical protein
VTQARVRAPDKFVPMAQAATSLVRLAEGRNPEGLLKYLEPSRIKP